jgi:hypothetical protein
MSEANRGVRGVVPPQEARMSVFRLPDLGEGLT